MKKNKNKFKIHYLYNSGFSLETSDNILIFDYYNDNSTGKERSLENGVVGEELLKKGKPIYVFVSHSHFDHFNPVIFNWCKLNAHVKYIISDDVTSIEKTSNYITVKKGETINLNSLTIKVYGSTDQGVSFLVNCGGLNIFHAGDLNWWHWKEDSDEENKKAEKWFKEEIENIKGENIHIAFFPVDPRQEEYYYLGGEYFIEKIKPEIFIPMHFGDKPEITKEFKEKMKNMSTKVFEISHRGFEI